MRDRAATYASVCWIERATARARVDGRLALATLRTFPSRTPAMALTLGITGMDGKTKPNCARPSTSRTPQGAGRWAAMTPTSS